jgi:pimeloyl-ACP methyl ester carboxylesterase
MAATSDRPRRRVRPLWILVAVAASPAALLAFGALLTLALTAWIGFRYPLTGRTVALSGGAIHVVEAGPADGPVVLLLHGASGSANDQMNGAGRLLAERGLRVLAVDRPGHGYSDRFGRESADLGRQAALIRAALVQLKVPRAVVVGYSLAGALALRFALDHPDAVAGLALLSPVSHPWPNGTISWYYGLVTHPLVGQLIARTVTAPLGMLVFEGAITAVFSPEPPVAGYRDLAQAPLVLRPATFLANAEDVAGLHAAVTAQSPRYRTLKVPTVIVAGDADRIVWTNLHSRSLEREIEGARLVVLPGVGHMPHYTAKERVADEIASLTARVAAR